MKKKIITIISTLLLINTVVFAAPETVKVIVNGKELVTDTPAVIRNSRTMVPFRALFESLGANNITWDEPTQKVTGSDGSTTVSLVIGKNDITVNGQVITMDTPPMIINSRTMIPLSAVSKAMGGTIDWNGVDYVATVTKSVAQVSDSSINNSAAPIFDDIVSSNPNNNSTNTNTSNSQSNSFDDILISNTPVNNEIVGFYAMEDLKRNQYMLNLKSDKTAEIINISSSEKQQGTYSYSENKLVLNIKGFNSSYTRENVTYDGVNLLFMREVNNPNSGTTFVLLKTTNTEYEKYSK